MDCKKGGLMRFGNIAIFSPSELYKIEKVYKLLKDIVPGLTRQDLKDLMKKKVLYDSKKLKKLDIIVGGAKFLSPLDLLKVEIMYQQLHPMNKSITRSSLKNSIKTGGGIKIGEKTVLWSLLDLIKLEKVYQDTKKLSPLVTRQYIKNIVKEKKYGIVSPDKINKSSITSSKF